MVCYFQLKEEQSVHGSDEEVEDDPPEQEDTDFSDDDDNKRDHEEVRCVFQMVFFRVGPEIVGDIDNLARA